MVVVVCVRPVPALVSVTVAPATGAPALSVTRPRIDATVVWATAGMATARLVSDVAPTSSRRIANILLIASSPFLDPVPLKGHLLRS